MMETLNLSFQTINWKKQERGPFMTNDELSRYILHYVKEDRTHSAIMLTAGWGAGKSYYTTDVGRKRHRLIASKTVP